MILVHNTCCAIFITYNPDASLVKNIYSVLTQVPEILIVDNGSNSDSLSMLEELSKEECVNIKYNPTNLGIATALNQGVNYASENGYDWVVTFDQDSLAPDNYIQTMIEAYQDCEDRDSVAIIAPRYKTNTGLISFSKDNSHNSSFSIIKTTITSGNIVSVAALHSVGLFDDSFFIDYVDHEFCLRVRSKGWLVIESHLSLLFHNIGNSTLYKLGKIDIITSGHAPIRRYYKYRNLIVTLKKYYWFDPWIIVDLKALIFEPLKIVLFEDDKLSKLACICKGVLDGCTTIPKKRLLK